MTSKVYRALAAALWLLIGSLPAAGGELGWPAIEVHRPASFGGHPGSSNVLPLDDGRIAVSNTKGLAIFDGARWRLYEHPLGNTGFLRMVRTPKGEFCGGYPGEIGCFVPRPDGGYRWHSLQERLPPAMREFNKVFGQNYDDVRHGIWFVAQTKLLFVPDDTAEPVVELLAPANGWVSHRNTLVLYLSGKGIFKVSESGPPAFDVLAPVEDIEQKLMVGIHPLEDGRFLAIQLGGRASLLAGGRGTRVWADGEDLRRRQLPSAFQAISGGRYALGFQRGPVTIVDADGRTLQHLGEKAGLRETAVIDIAEDRQGGLWVTQTNTITRIDQASATTFYGPEFGSARVNSLERWRDRIFISSQFRMLALDTSVDPAQFRPYQPAADLQVGYVMVRGPRLYTMGSDFREFSDLESAPLLIAGTGHLSPSRLNRDLMYTQIGGKLAAVAAGADGATFTPLPLPLHALTDVVEASSDELWMHRDNGQLSRMRKGPDGQWLAPEWVTDTGLPAGQFFLRRGPNALWAGTRDGVYRLSTGGRFVPAAELPVHMRSGPIDELVEDDEGHLWMQSPTHLGVAWREGKTFRWDATPLAALDPKMLVRYFQREGNILWVLKYDGVARIDLAAQRRHLPQVTPILTGLWDDRTREPLPLKRWQASPNSRVRIEFALPAMQRREGNALRFRLAGFSDEFSPWSSRSEFEFADLSPGRYAFQVEGRDAWGRVSQAELLTFSVPPPWYRQWWALALYALVAGCALALAARLGARRRQRQMLMRQTELEATVAARTTELHDKNLQLAEQAERLLAVDRLKTQFFINVGHEFRTPLTLVLGPIDDLLRDARERLSERVRGQLQLAQRNARRVLDLIVELLDVNRLEQGQLTLSSATHDLLPLLQHVAAENAPLVARFGQQLSVDCGGFDRAPCVIDPLQIERALSNLISNAAKYSPRGTAIELTLAREEQVWSIAVRDQGRGIAPDALPHVFDRFFQTDGSDRASGYGIGLSLVREIALAHGGEVTATSTLGVGSSFVLRLPVAADDTRGSRHGATLLAVPGSPPTSADAPRDGSPVAFDETAEKAREITSQSVAQETEGTLLGTDHTVAPETDGTLPGTDKSVAPWRDPQGSDGEARSGRERVLIVDDHDDLRLRVRDVLGHRYEVIEAANGDQAWQRARDELPDLIVSDVMMPGCDGVELTRRLRSHADTEAIGILLLTAKVGSEHAVAGLQAGANDYLAKPFDSSELLARCEAIVAHARRLQHRLAAAAPAAPTGTIETPDTRWRQRLDQCIVANLHEPQFGIEELSQAMHADRTQLFRKCKELLGQSPSDYLRDTRLAHGHRLLEQGAGNVSEIAYASGFESLSSFTRAFKVRYGVPPSQVRGRAA